MAGWMQLPARWLLAASWPWQPPTSGPPHRCSCMPTTRVCAAGLQVNNAGITRDKLMMQMKPEDWQVGCITRTLARSLNHLPSCIAQAASHSSE